MVRRRLAPADHESQERLQVQQLHQDSNSLQRRRGDGGGGGRRRGSAGSGAPWGEL